MTYQFIVSISPSNIMSKAKIRPHNWISAQSDDINHIQVVLRRHAEKDMNMDEVELNELNDLIQRCYGILIDDDKFKGITVLFGDNEMMHVAILNEEDMAARENEINVLLGLEAIAENPRILN